MKHKLRRRTIRTIKPINMAYGSLRPQRGTLSNQQNPFMLNQPKKTHPASRGLSRSGRNQGSQLKPRGSIQNGWSVSEFMIGGVLPRTPPLSDIRLRSHHNTIADKYGVYATYAGGAYSSASICIVYAVLNCQNVARLLPKAYLVRVSLCKLGVRGRLLLRSGTVGLNCERRRNAITDDVDFDNIQLYIC